MFDRVVCAFLFSSCLVVSGLRFQSTENAPSPPHPSHTSAPHPPHPPSPTPAPTPLSTKGPVTRPPSPLPTPSPSSEAVGDPHVTSLTGQKFDLWRDGWSTFVRVPDREQVKLLVRGNVQAYGEGGCAPAFLHDMELSGSWLGDTTIFVRAGSLESTAPFAVSVNGSSFMEITDISGTEFLSTPGVSVRGEITQDEPEWGPDAKVVIKMDQAEVALKQHTEGRGDESRSMLDLSVGGLDAVEGTVGGWLGVDGSRNAGQPPAHCPTVLLSTSDQHESRKKSEFIVGFHYSRDN
eukprot:CAMPEP_0194501876 /NCGR_PEP_ID=MMETSP0253-20130528/23411_1 /TAXON_ID=2966 /ORGANISM="Noctiluca scintillans" /LENGTH=292 /DNA_ID=CAMNT_0039343927 /DNA_START=50 /DNA_END=928 /DNA_ORIENTATION=+